MNWFRNPAGLSETTYYFVLDEAAAPSGLYSTIRALVKRLLRFEREDQSSPSVSSYP